MRPAGAVASFTDFVVDILKKRSILQTLFHLLIRRRKNGFAERLDQPLSQVHFH